MKIEVSDYYKDKVKAAYVVTNPEPRRVCVMVYSDGTKHSMSYAKYLYTSHYRCSIPEGEEIDHINGDKMDDRIENLQRISKKDNILKEKSGRSFIERSCPVCGTKFMFETRNLSTHPNPCCSRKCGGIKSHWKKWSKKIRKKVLLYWKKYVSLHGQRKGIIYLFKWHGCREASMNHPELRQNGSPARTSGCMAMGLGCT